MKSERGGEAHAKSATEKQTELVRAYGASGGRKGVVGKWEICEGQIISFKLTYSGEQREEGDCKRMKECKGVDRGNSQGEWVAENEKKAGGKSNRMDRIGRMGVRGKRENDKIATLQSRGLVMGSGGGKAG